MNICHFLSHIFQKIQEWKAIVLPFAFLFLIFFLIYLIRGRNQD